MYKLIFEKRALRDLNKLDRQIKERIWNKLQDCKENPFIFLKPLIQIRGFKLRVGDYRIIIDVREEIRILTVLKIGHRKNIYER
ncbi:type II toxin-antitoxin system RelE/ParE family toxin [Candidatus Pacearchaeota archaeon]|nr:type II toxin-antitoxin system RelE/ParE family toxin [Candidatus Pacearchaeota archaeon]